MNIVKEACPVGALEDGTRLTIKLWDKTFYIPQELLERSWSCQQESYPQNKLRVPTTLARSNGIRPYPQLDHRLQQQVRRGFLLLDIIKVFVTALWVKNTLWITIGWSFPANSSLGVATTRTGEFSRGFPSF